MSNVQIQEWARQAKEALSTANLAVDQMVGLAKPGKEITLTHSRYQKSRAELIYKLLLDAPEGLNSFKLQKATGIKATALRYAMNFLISEGLVEGVGERRSRIYRIIPQN